MRAATDLTKSLRLVCLALLALTGCEDAPQSSLIDMRVESARDFLISASKDGPVLVELLGEPLTPGGNLAPGAFAALVGTAFGAEPWIKMTADAARAPQPDFRLIWVVDPVAWLSPDAACQGKAAPGSMRRAERVELRAYFCSGQRTLSAVQGTVKRPSSPDDGMWQQLVRQMSRQLVGNRVSG